MKILVTGANGLLGQHLCRRLALDGETVIATGKGPCRMPGELKENFRYVEMDFTNDTAIDHVFRSEMPDFIVHAGAMTQLDACEQSQEACLEANVQGTAQLLVAAEAHCKYFLYVSTDFVFDGIKGNYSEDDHLNPLSWYGFTKVQAESTVETSEIPWAIVRTCLVYGDPVAGTRSNILTWVRDSLEAGKQIQVVSDQVRTPTYVDDLVDGIVRMLRLQAEGIFHVSGKNILTPYDMALAAAKHLGLDATLIQRADASSFTQPAKRPPKTGFNISKARSVLGYEPQSFERNLQKLWPQANSPSGY